jgi:hypothetical protein
LPAESNSSSGGTRTAHNVTFSTTNPNTFVFEVEAADTTSYSNPGDDAGWTLIVDQVGAGYGQTYVAYQVYTSAQSSVTQNVWAAQTTAEGDIASIDALQAAAATGSTGVWDSTEAIDALAAASYPVNTGPWISFDRRDIFAAAGYTVYVGAWASTDAKDIFVSSIPTSWHSTEAPDRLTATVYTPGESMEWVYTEPVDIVNATGYIADLGSWASPEAKDIFSVVGAGASAPKGRRIFLAC